MMKYAFILLLGAMAACASAPAAEKESPAPAVFNTAESGLEYLFTVADANAEQTLRVQLDAYGFVSAEKISADLFLVKFSRPAQLKELEKKVDGKIIKAVQPNFKYRQYKVR